jgi:hypothetical protein
MVERQAQRDLAAIIASEARVALAHVGSDTNAVVFICAIGKRVAIGFGLAINAVPAVLAHTKPTCASAIMSTVVLTQSDVAIRACPAFCTIANTFGKTCSVSIAIVRTQLRFVQFGLSE